MRVIVFNSGKIYTLHTHTNMHFILSLYSQLMGQNKGTFYGTSFYFGSESQCIGELILS